MFFFVRESLCMLLIFVTNIQVIDEFDTHNIQCNYVDIRSAIYLNSTKIVQRFRFSNFIAITISIYSENKLYCADFHCDDFVEAPYALQERDR